MGLIHTRYITQCIPCDVHKIPEEEKCTISSIYYILIYRFTAIKATFN